jgi:nucleoside-triphosphatase THEP1
VSAGEPGAGSARILLLTGDRGAGKSTLCELLAGEAERRGVPIGGIACPAVFGPDGTKIGCRVRDLASGEERELGSTVRDLGGPRWKGWSFSREGFEAANRAVLAALDRGAGLVILDEVGPVELSLGAGLEPALEALDRRPAGTDRAGSGRHSPDGGDSAATGSLVLLVVRPELAEELERRYPGSGTIRVDPGDHRAALELAREALFRIPNP